MGTFNLGQSAGAHIVAPVSIYTRRRLLAYLVAPVFGPILLLVVACFIVPSRWLALRSQNTYLMSLGYGGTLHGADCQVVVYGDSSAMVGVDPAVIRQRTGLSTCNIAEFEGMTILNGTLVVDRYMAQNARPRFMVFLYAPEDLNPQSERHSVGTFEALTWRIAQTPRLSNLLAALQYPDDFFGWAELGLRLAAERAQGKPASSDVSRLRADHSGQLPVQGPTLTECEKVGRPLSQPDRAWISGLRSKYGREGTTVLIDATPVPPCDLDLAHFKTSLPGVIDNSVQTMPLEMFLADGRLHTNATGSALLSNMLSDQIIRQMIVSSGKGDR